MNEDEIILTEEDMINLYGAYSLDDLYNID